MTEIRKTLTINPSSLVGTKKSTTGVKVERRRRIFRPDSSMSSSQSASGRAEHLKSILSQANKNKAEDQKKKEEAQALDAKRRSMFQEETQKKEEIREKLSEVVQETQKEISAKKFLDKKPLKETSFVKESDDKKEGRRVVSDDSRRRLTVKDILQNNGEVNDTRRRSVASIRRRLEKQKRKGGDGFSDQEDKKFVRTVLIPETISVKDFATRMSEKSATVVKKLMEMGIMATINQVIDADTAELIASDLGHKFQRIGEGEVV
ncbi:MAG: translation initiation factor IF-2 N-terminal domain-containing protein, partial [Alphaproteobacteria bacterium]|nr:translation initiation factor IF-2 N-terminal domain-containing protein [Alphaproteobacteria bacterium]